MLEAPPSENRIARAMRELGIEKKTYERAGLMLNTLLGRRKQTRKKDYDGQEGSIEDFFMFALPRVTAAQGQLFQDLWVLWELDEKENGYFVEFGATNGITMSNSHILEKSYGWSGIVAEPNPEYHERLARERSCVISHKCVYSSSDQVMKFFCAEKALMSRLSIINPHDHNEETGRRELKKEIDVETISLNDLLELHEAPEEIDYMSVDTEGSELEILNAFDFDRRFVKMFTVEHNFTPMRADIFELMTKNGYVRRFPEYTRFDDWYIHRDVTA